MQRSFMSSALKKWKHQQVHIWKYNCIHSQDQRRQTSLKNDCTWFAPCKMMSIGAVCCMCQNYFSMQIFPELSFILYLYKTPKIQIIVSSFWARNSPPSQDILKSITSTVLCHDYKLLQALDQFQLPRLTQGEKSTDEASLFSHSLQKSQTLH